MTGNFPLQTPETGLSPEVLAQPERTPSMPELLQKCETLKGDSNQDQQEFCKLFNPEIPKDQQQDRIAVLEGRLTDVIEKLMKEGVSVTALTEKPQLLRELAVAQGIKLEPVEQTALSVLDDLLAQPGTISAHFREAQVWTRMIEVAGDIFRGPKEFFNKCIAERPGLTMAVSASVLIGMGILGYTLFSGSDEKKPEEKESGMGTKTKMALGLSAIAAIVGYFKGDDLKQMVKDSVKDQTIKAFGEGEKKVPRSIDVNKEKLEKPDGSKIVCIGDSMMKGMSGRAEWTKNPDFIGEVGMASGKTLDRLKESESRKKLEGKEEALIYTGGNNVENDPPKKIVADMIEMAQISRKAGIKDITICTRFPIDPRRKEVPHPPRPDPKNPGKMIKDTKRLGPEKFSKRQEANMALRDELIKAYQADMFPPNTKLVDLFGYFANENGEMRQEFVKGDYLHPYDAYVPALNYMRA